MWSGKETSLQYNKDLIRYSDRPFNICIWYYEAKQIQ